MWRPGGIGVDLNGDGISDVRVGSFGGVRPDVGLAYGGMGYPGMGRVIDFNGDRISDIHVGPYKNVRPDVGMFVREPYGPSPYY